MAPNLPRKERVDIKKLMIASNLDFSAEKGSRRDQQVNRVDFISDILCTEY